jgi:hypothetical protein
MPFDRRNIPLGTDVKQEISGAKNIFEVFYSMSRETPPGAYPLNTGEWIRGCQTLYPEFYAKALEYQPKGYIRVVSNETYESELASTGQCGAFVISNGDIRLPKITRYIRGYESEQAGNVHNKTYLSGLPGLTLAMRYDVYYPADQYPHLPGYGNNCQSLSDTSTADEPMLDTSILPNNAKGGDLIKDAAYGRYNTDAFGFSNEVVAPCVTMALYIQVFNRVPITGYVQIKDVLELVTNYTKEMEQKYNEAIDAVNSILSSGSLGIPDYANYVVVSGSSYTAPSDGWIYNRWVRGGTGATLILTTYIYADSSKSRLLFTYTNSDGRRPDKDSGTTDITNFLPVRKGYYIEWTTMNKTNGTLTNYFYPTFGQ